MRNCPLSKQNSCKEKIKGKSERIPKELWGVMKREVEF
jgi:hypothetical protein